MKFKEVIHFIGIFFFFITILLGGLLLTGDPLEFIAIGILLSFALYYLIKLILNKKEETHPKQYDYCINKLGCGKVMDFIGVNYT